MNSFRTHPIHSRLALKRFLLAAAFSTAHYFAWIFFAFAASDGSQDWALPFALLLSFPLLLIPLIPDAIAIVGNSIVWGLVLSSLVHFFVRLSRSNNHHYVDIDSVNGISLTQIPEPHREMFELAETHRLKKDLASSTPLICRIIDSLADKTDPISQATLVEALVCRAVNHMHASEFDAASSKLAAALTINPDRCIAHFNLGCIYDKLGDSAKALASYGTALTLKPNYYKALIRRGVLLKRLSRTTEARSDFAAARNINARRRNG